MHPLFHEQMAKQRVEQLQREAAAMQRVNRVISSSGHAARKPRNQRPG